MLEKEEQEAIDKIQETEMDFYAPLMYLCLSRAFRKLGRADVDVRPIDILDIVQEAYKDLQRKFDTE